MEQSSFSGRVASGDAPVAVAVRFPPASVFPAAGPVDRVDRVVPAGGSVTLLDAWGAAVAAQDRFAARDVLVDPGCPTRIADRLQDMYAGREVAAGSWGAWCLSVVAERRVNRMKTWSWLVEVAFAQPELMLGSVLVRNHGVPFDVLCQVLSAPDVTGNGWRLGKAWYARSFYSVFTRPDLSVGDARELFTLTVAACNPADMLKHVGRLSHAVTAGSPLDVVVAVGLALSTDKPRYSNAVRQMLCDVLWSHIDSFVGDTDTDAYVRTKMLLTAWDLLIITQLSDEQSVRVWDTRSRLSAEHDEVPTGPDVYGAQHTGVPGVYRDRNFSLREFDFIVRKTRASVLENVGCAEAVLCVAADIPELRAAAGRHPNCPVTIQVEVALEHAGSAVHARGGGV